MKRKKLSCTQASDGIFARPPARFDRACERVADRRWWCCLRARPEYISSGFEYEHTGSFGKGALENGALPSAKHPSLQHEVHTVSIAQRVECRNRRFRSVATSESLIEASIGTHSWHFVHGLAWPVYSRKFPVLHACCEQLFASRARDQSTSSSYVHYNACEVRRRTHLRPIEERCEWSRR